MKKCSKIDTKKWRKKMKRKMKGIKKSWEKIGQAFRRKKTLVMQNTCSELLKLKEKRTTQ